ncbi:MAG: hypothetical protein OXQ29_18675 [Rhodospirillaceae bacterium]|nr:hypothetical protein [Rhodospirillaceae bacterium]
MHADIMMDNDMQLLSVNIARSEGQNGEKQGEEANGALEGAARQTIHDLGCGDRKSPEDLCAA